jgi:hypothetical protein
MASPLDAVVFPPRRHAYMYHVIDPGLPWALPQCGYQITYRFIGYFDGLGVCDDSDRWVSGREGDFNCRGRSGRWEEGREGARNFPGWVQGVLDAEGLEIMLALWSFFLQVCIV